MTSRPDPTPFFLLIILQKINIVVDMEFHIMIRFRRNLRKVVCEIKILI
jgi:hypothetical protein